MVDNKKNRLRAKRADKTGSKTVGTANFAFDESDPLGNLQHFSHLIQGVEQEVCKHIIGQQKVVRLTTLSFLAGGNVLLLGPPGTGKTKLAEVFGGATGLNAQRIQFTPDLMPNDVIGSEILMKNSQTGETFFKFIDGPLLGEDHAPTQLLHADEINRASARVQAALLQAMQERKVSLPNKATRRLDPLFTVVATQNPGDHEGTYPLPEAQIDRFVMGVYVPHLSREDARTVLRMTRKKDVADGVVACCTADDLLTARKIVQNIAVPKLVEDYFFNVDELARETGFSLDQVMEITSLKADKARTVHETLTELAKIFKFETDRGGMRVDQALDALGRSSAFMRGSPVVELQDVQPLVVPVLIHRMGEPRRRKEGGMTPAQALEKLSLDLMR